MRVLVDGGVGGGGSWLVERLSAALRQAEHELLRAEATDTASFASLVPSVDAVLLDLTAGGAEQRNVELLQAAAAAAASEQPLVLLCLSSCLTAAAGSSSRRPLREKAYKKRQAVQQAVGLRTLESAALALERDGLRVYVLACGLVYGDGEDALLPLFRAAWMSQALPVVGAGDNAVPTLHVRDLAAAILHVLAAQPDTRYLYAADDAVTTQRQLVTAISTALGCGAVAELDLASAAAAPPFASSSTSPLLLPLLTCDARLAADCLQSADPPLQLESAAGPVAAMPALIAAFTAAHRALPVRVWLTGPPCSGQSHWAQQVAQRWRLPLLRVAELIDGARSRGDELTAAINADLEQQAAAIAERQALKVREAGKKSGGAAAAAAGKKSGQAAGDSKQAAAAASEPRLSAALLARIVRRRLADSDCRNTGFVLDGFPRSADEASALFLLPPDTAAAAEGAEAAAADGADTAADSEHKEGAAAEADQAEADPAAEDGGATADAGDSEAAGGRKLRVDPSTFPTAIIRLQISEAAALARVRALPHVELVVGHNDEAGFRRRWAAWQTQEADGTTAALAAVGGVLDVLELAAGDEQQLPAAVALYVDAGGRKENFHPTEAELQQEAAQRQAEAAAAATDAARLQQEERLVEERRVAERLRQDAERRRLVTAEEAALVEAASAPLRSYLLQHVMPAVMDGLLDVVRQRPLDPIEHLAQFLYRYALQAPDVHDGDATDAPATAPPTATVDLHPVAT